MRIVRIFTTIILTLAGGLLMAIVLYTVTSPRLGGCCSTVGDASQGWTDYVRTPGRVDPWTGEVRLETTSYSDINGQRFTHVRELRPEDDHPVIPLPAGFVIGSLLTLAVIRRRAATPDAPPLRKAVMPPFDPDMLAAMNRDRESGSGAS